MREKMESTRQRNLRRLIVKSLGAKKASEYFAYRLDGYNAVSEAASEIMSSVPPSFGSCVLISSAWAGLLSDHFNIPAVVVAGSLKIDGKYVFKYEGELPKPTKSNSAIEMTWSGHCWIEIDGKVGDLSIFRTAYSIQRPSRLKDFVISNFGYGRGAFLASISELPKGLKYEPNSVLTNEQVNMFISSLSYQIEKGI
jgi:hypothetical protein